MRVDFARSIGKRRNSVFFCRLLGVEVLASMLFVSVCSGQPPTTPSPIPTNRSDNARSGANVNETILTPSNVNKEQFGALFNYPIDYLALAQPLYVSGVSIPGKGTHNVVYVATMADSVYAFDADSNAGSNATPLWWVNFTNSAIYGPGITTANTVKTLPCSGGKTTGFTQEGLSLIHICALTHTALTQRRGGAFWSLASSGSIAASAEMANRISQLAETQVTAST